jgi:hypothetical protein
MQIEFANNVDILLAGATGLACRAPQEVRTMRFVPAGPLQ